MKRLALVVIGCGLCAGTASTHAETMSTVGGGAAGFSGEGTLYAQANPGTNTYTIIGIDGTGVTGLVDQGKFTGYADQNGSYSNDNQLLPSSSPSLTSGGFAFTDTMGDTNFLVDLFARPKGGYGVRVLDSDGVLTANADATFSLGTPVATMSAMRSFFAGQRNSVSGGTVAFRFSFAQATATTPEPSSFALLATGLAGFAVRLRRRVR